MSVSIIHLTDIHFGCENAQAVEAAVAFAHEHKPTLTLVTGDLTMEGQPAEFIAARAWLDRLPQPLVVTPGNHDTPYWNFPLRATVPFRRYKRWIGAPERAAFDAPGLVVRAVNSARGAQPRLDWSKGAMNIAECERVAADFRAAEAGALRVFACHHPLIEAVGSPVTGDTHRGRACTEVLAAGGADLIVSGHVHVPFALPFAVGDEKTYGVGGGTLSQRLRGTPASFNVITADAETVAVVAQAWSGSHFEPWRTWSLPRRGAEVQTSGTAAPSEASAA